MNKPHPAATDQQWELAQQLAKKLNCRPTVFLPLGAGYTTPSPDEVFNLIKHSGLNFSEVARVLGINEKMPRRWVNNKNPDQYRPIVPAYWFYLLALLNLRPVEPLKHR